MVLSVFFGIVLVHFVAGDSFSRNYIYVPQSKTQSAANSYCSSTYGTTLASIHSASDLDEIQSLKGSSVSVFIGLMVDTNTYQITSGYKNVDGSSWDYATDVSGGAHPWSGSEPNHGGSIVSNDQLCVQVYPSGLLDDVSCDQSKYFICNNPGYKLVQQYKNQHDADQYCENTYGFHLASITSDTENAAVAAVVGNSIHAFIGLQRVSGTSPWFWEDGTAFGSNSYGFCAAGAKDCGAPWYPGEPNDGGGQQDCGQFYGDYDKWDDVSCGVLKYFVCNLFDRKAGYAFNGNLMAISSIKQPYVYNNSYYYYVVTSIMVAVCIAIYYSWKKYQSNKEQKQVLTFDDEL